MEFGGMGIDRLRYSIDLCNNSEDGKSVAQWIVFLCSFRQVSFCQKLENFAPHDTNTGHKDAAEHTIWSKVIQLPGR